jgi:transposase
LDKREVAIRRKPHLRGFYERLVSGGCKSKQALLAVVRKLLHAIFGMFRTLGPYDRTLVYRFPLANCLET